MVTFHYTQLHQRYPTHGRSCQQEFTKDKKAATIRHVLTHTGGFPMITFPFLRYDWEETIRGLSKMAWFIDAAAIASELGAPIVVNIVMMGALVGAGQLPLDMYDLEIEIRDSFPPEAAELNLKAFKKGIDSVGAAP